MENTVKPCAAHPLRRTVVLELLLGVLPMLLRAALIAPVALYIEGDVFRETEYNILSAVSEFIAVAAFFAALGAVIYSLFALSRRACALVLAVFAAGEAAALAIALIWQSVFSVSTSPSMLYYFLIGLSGYAVDALTVAGAIFIALLLRRRMRRNDPPAASPAPRFFSAANPLNVAGLAAAALSLVITLIRNAVETISLVSQYGAPVNLTELLYLVTPYLDAFIYFAIGYAMTALTAIVLNRE